MALQVWLPLNKDLRNQGLADITVTNNGATFVNTEADSTRTVAAGKLGGCYNFNASTYLSENSYDWSNFNVQNFSLCCWYKEPSPIASGNSQMIAIGTSSGWNNIRIGLLRRTSTGCPLFTVSNGSSAIQYACSTTSFPLNTWVHICCTYNQGEMKIYLNGVLNTSLTTSITPVLNSSQHLGIGAASNGAEKLTGYLNDVRIYDHCLSPKEIKEISKGLVLHYKMNGAIENSENLAPFFSHSLDDVTESTINTDTYWITFPNAYKNFLDYATCFSDGWMHFEYEHSNATTNKEFVLLPLTKDNFGVTKNKQYTIMWEFKNFYGTNLNTSNISHMSQNNVKIYSTPSQSEGGMEYIYFKDIENQLIDNEAIIYLSCIANGWTHTNPASDNNMCNYWLWPVFIFFPNEKVSFDFRLSAYEGEYTGPYRPYIEKNLLSNSNGPFTGIVNDSTNNDFGSWPNAVEASAYDTYKVTFEAKASVENLGLMVYLFNNSSNIVQCASSVNNQNYSGTQTDGLSVFNLTTRYLTYHVIWKFNNNVTPAFKRLLFRLPDPTHSSLNTDYVGETAEIRNVRLEKISGNEPDCSGYNNDGEYTGTPTLYTDTAKYDASTKLTAAFDYVRCGRGGMVSDGITVNMWIKCDVWGVNPISCTEGGGWNFENNGGYIGFACYVAGIGYKSVKSSVTIDSLLGSWHMLTGIYDGRYTKIYVDGVLKGSLDTGSDNHKIAYNAANAIFIGAEAGGNALVPAANSTFIGNISDVRIYATPLNEADILELYHTSASIDNQHNLFCGEVVE